jgi:integrase
LWQCTKGEVSSDTLTKLRETVLKKYNSVDSHSKVLSFATSFLKFLATTRSEPQYQSFAPYLELPKALKERKNVTQRIVTTEDIENVLRYIKQAENNGKINTQRSAQYSAFVIFGAFTGQRSMATLANLTVGQFREALKSKKPVLHVESSQDKIRMEHYVPLHPQVVKAIKPILGDRKNEDRMFGYNSFQMWLKRNHVSMSKFNGHFELSDLRKFAEQHGDIIEWEHTNRSYVLTHGVSGVEWSHYKHPLPESVYDVYMKYWKNVSLDT